MKRLPILAASLCLCFILPLSFAQNEKDAKPAAKGNPEAGADVFDVHCYECHDPDTKERKTGPGLAGVKDGKLPSGDPATHEKLLEIINLGLGEEMPGFRNTLTDTQKEDLIAFVMTL